MSPLFSLLRALARMLLALLAGALCPPTCAACDARLPRRAVFCPLCSHTLEPCSRSDGSLVAFGVFGGALAVALRRLKYGARPDLAPPLAHLARRAAQEAGITADLVVPVPLHPRRLAERGYNQAALLAAGVAEGLAAPLAARALCRVRHTPQQALLDRKGRLENMVQAFRVRSPASVRGLRVVLVDDVVTTGATLAACKAELLAAGAISVIALVIARAERAGQGA